MVNPYQAPTEATAEQPESQVDAEFRLTANQIRSAESKFLLRRFGGRLSLASLLMVLLAVGVAFVELPFTSGGGTSLGFQVSLAVRELCVMVLATVLYLGLVRRPRAAIRHQLEQYGVVADVGISVEIERGRLIWTGSTGRHEFRLSAAQLINTGKGLMIDVAPDLFLFVPRQAHFRSGYYRRFVRRLRRGQKAK